MGWIGLIAGILFWVGAHYFKRLAPARRAAMGDKGRGLVALLIVAGIGLMILGYRATEYVHVWSPPAFFVHINNLLMLIALYLLSPAPKRGKLVSGMRHPMLAGFKAWAVAHLLVNGDLASILLFGGLLAWAVGSVILINRAEPTWTRRAGGTLAMDAVFAVASVVLLAVVGYVHAWLGVWPFPS